MQIHAVKHLLAHLEEYETMFQLCSTFLPAPHGAIFSCTSCIFSERLCCLSSVLTQLALHQTGLFPVTYVQSSFCRNQTRITYKCFHFVSFLDLQHGHPSAGLSRYGDGDVQRGEDTCWHAWPGCHSCLQCLCPGVNSGEPRG